MEILEVSLQLIHQPDGCVGYKVGIKTDEPSTQDAWYYPVAAPRELISSKPVDHTWFLFGAIVTPSSEHAVLERLVEGDVPSVPEGHDPYHGRESFR